MRLTLEYMNKLLTVIAVLALGAVTVTAQHQVPAPVSASSDDGKIAGNWQVSIETPHGKRAGVFRIQQEGSKLSGVCEIEGHGSNPITGTIEGKEVALNVTLHQMTLKLKGAVDGAKMSGSSDQGVTWTATRQ